VNHSKGNSARLAGAIDVIVIGAGHAGLSASHMLTEHGVQHIVLERGKVANSWRNERWDSLKLLTPNWQTRLPGYHYAGEDPEGYMGMSGLVQFMQDYADQSHTPVLTNTNVTSVRKKGDVYYVTTDRGAWIAKAVIIASGACNTPSVPALAGNFPVRITQLTGHDYRSPKQIAAGGVLIVGASASGMQIADELLKAGHQVNMSVGEHVRMPRHYRGRNILDWMDQCGILNERYDEVEDIARGRRLPSSQLVGSNDRQFLDLNTLTDQGAKITGRLMGVNNGVAQFSGSLRNVVALADLKMKRLLNSIDEYIADQSDIAPAEQFDDTQLDENPLLTLDLEASSIRTIIWATGFKPDYSWLDVPVLDRKGQLKHDGGIVESPGLYVLGLPLMRRRKSSFIFGIEDDARDITDHLFSYLDSNYRRNTHGVHQHNSPQPGIRRNL
jgi:putative flavoprotein involved in K+ transport